MKKFNSDIVRTFTARLSELCCSGVSLKEALGVLKDLKGFEKEARKLCAEVLYALESGSAFSMALKESQNARFPQWYVAFIEVAEESGELEKTLDFLNETLETKFRESQALIGNLAYPAFLVVLAAGFGVFLKMHFGTGNFSQALAFLWIVFFAFFFATKKLFGENHALIFLNAMAFLWERETPFEKSLESAASCVSENQKLFSTVAKIKDEISNGKNIAECFERNFSLSGFSFCGKVLGLNLALYTAGNSGNPFEKTLKVARAKAEKQKKIFLALEQPLLLAAAAIFILLVVGDLNFLYEVKI